VAGFWRDGQINTGDDKDRYIDREKIKEDGMESKQRSLEDN
jgi:hypothetical protein